MPAAPPIGTLLRDRRTERGMSIEEVAWRLRIRPELLRALEDENFGELGHPGFVRTHLRSYARELGLDAGEVLRVYKRRHQTAEPSPLTALDQKEKVARKQRPRSRWMLAACLASAGLIAASVVGFLRGPGAPPAASPESLPAGPRISFEQASRTFRPARTEQVTIRIAAVKLTTVRIVVDGKQTFEGVLAPGASRLYSGTRLIEIDVSDSRAVAIWANDARYTPPAGAWRGSFNRFGLVAA